MIISCNYAMIMPDNAGYEGMSLTCTLINNMLLMCYYNAQLWALYGKDIAMVLELFANMQMIISENPNYALWVTITRSSCNARHGMSNMLKYRWQCRVKCQDLQDSK